MIKGAGKCCDPGCFTSQSNDSGLPLAGSHLDSESKDPSWVEDSVTHRGTAGNY